MGIYNENDWDCLCMNGDHGGAYVWHFEAVMMGWADTRERCWESNRWQWENVPSKLRNASSRFGT
jgi:hypothetical protein